MTVPANDGYAGPFKLPIGRVATLRLTGQSSAVAPTALVTAPAVGLYRVSLCLAITAAGGGGTLTLSVISTGDGGVAQTQSLAAVTITTPGNIAQDAFVCEVASGNINYQVVGVGLSPGLLQYSVRAVVEQLSVAP